MAEAALDRRIAALRRFNRFYTQKIGVLEEGLLASPFSLTEARVLHDLARAGEVSAARLGKQLGLDRGYLSRILHGFERRRLISRSPSAEDRRVSLLRLTEAGEAAFAELDQRSQQAIGALLRSLREAERNSLVAAAATIERTLGGGTDDRALIVLRPPRAGDLGWVVSRHGAIYAEEYGWNGEFEALVADIAAKFLHDFDPGREACWIAERDGGNVGSVMLVAASDRVAKLRLLLVEPAARGFGIGGRLIEECLRFARQAGYREMSLWTNSVLVAARRLYQRAGFRLVESEPHHSFGRDLVGETWTLTL
jgi:DNA-binding MarR family transcriptional regulator/GNAT superfamily N-acetyltransferase